MDNLEKYWQSVLGELELAISRPNFNTWFKNTFIFELGGDKVVIGVPNAFTKAWLEKKYHDQIINSLEKVISRGNLQVIYKVEALGSGANISQTPQVSEQKPTRPVNNLGSGESKPNGRFGLDPHYNFDTFVVGPGNELAQAAAKAAAQQPGEIYNPLFIYGGVGLGKTHLVQAVGNYIIQKDPSKKVRYINSEKFINDFIYAIKNGRTESFKQNYREIDVLLIDDIQFIAGKEQTQEEFFHTFNALHQAKKQIVLSSDRPPKAIPGIESRLISRFEWGMIADISFPDFETRVAILELKCQEKRWSLDKEIINYIAEAVQDNIRELEGALNRIIAFHQLNNTQATLEGVKSLLGGLSANIKKSGLTSRKLLNAVSSFFGIDMDDLLGSSRKRSLVVPRQVAMFLMREELKASYPNIGQDVGGRDHTTAMHAYIKIQKMIEVDEKIKNDVLILRQKIYE